MTSLSQGLAIAGGGGGGGGGAPTPPGGATTELQFNDAGAFAGAVAATYDKATKQVIINTAGLSPAELAGVVAAWGSAFIITALDTVSFTGVLLVGKTRALDPGPGEQGYSAFTFTFVDAAGVHHDGFEWEGVHKQGTGDAATDAAGSAMQLYDYYNSDYPFSAFANKQVWLGYAGKRLTIGADGSLKFENGAGTPIEVAPSGAVSLSAHRLIANGVDAVPVFTNVAGATAGALVASNQQTIACAALGPVLVTVRGTGNPKVRTHEAGPGDGPPSQHAVLGNGDVFFIEATAPAVVTYVGSGFSGTWTVAT